MIDEVPLQVSDRGGRSERCRTVDGRCGMIQASRIWPVNVLCFMFFHPKNVICIAVIRPKNVVPIAIIRPKNVIAGLDLMAGNMVKCAA